MSYDFGFDVPLLFLVETFSPILPLLTIFFVANQKTENKKREVQGVLYIQLYYYKEAYRKHDRKCTIGNSENAGINKESEILIQFVSNLNLRNHLNCWYHSIILG